MGTGILTLRSNAKHPGGFIMDNQNKNNQKQDQQNQQYKNQQEQQNKQNKR